MTRDARLTDAQIEQLLLRRTSDPYAGLVRDILGATSDLDQERTWRLAWPSTRLSVLVAAALLAGLLVGGALATGALRQLWDPGPPLRATWTGPIQPDVAGLEQTVVARDEPSQWRWPGTTPETSDVEPAGIDITSVRYSELSGRNWAFDLRGDAPFPTSQTVAFGVVLDEGADGVADCVVGISNGGPPQGEYREWVTNLTTGETQERVGPPYGRLVDWGTGRTGPSLTITLRGSEACDLEPRAHPAFYAWTSTSEGDEVTAWDYAPDGAWLVPASPPPVTSQAIRLDAGTYRMPASSWSVGDVTGRVPDDWSVQYGHEFRKGGDIAGVGFQPIVVDSTFADACAGAGGTRRAIGGSVDDLAAALANQAGPSVGDPVPATLGGHAGVRVDLMVPEGFDLGGCELPDALRLAYSVSSDSNLVVFPETVASVYILDVEGDRQVFVSHLARQATPADRAELQAVLDSIRIEPSQP